MSNRESGALGAIIEYLLDNGASRPVQISEDLDMPGSTVSTILRRNKTLFVRTQRRDAVWYDIAPKDVNARYVKLLIDKRLQP